MITMTDYQRVFCKYCKDKEKKDCEIRMCIDNKPRCKQYELDRDKLKEEYGGILWNFYRKK